MAIDTQRRQSILSLRFAHRQNYHHRVAHKLINGAFVFGGDAGHFRQIKFNNSVRVSGSNSSESALNP